MSLIDIDECSTNTHNCDINAICTDTNRSFICDCINGYTGDGQSCQGLFHLLTMFDFFLYCSFHLPNPFKACLMHCSLYFFTSLKLSMAKIDCLEFFPAFALVYAVKKCINYIAILFQRSFLN
jgi:hypothetical protein